MSRIPALLQLRLIRLCGSQLSTDALDALKHFYGERDSRQKQFEDLKAQAENEFDSGKPLSMDVFTEDWNASQFWVSFDLWFSEDLLLTMTQYNDETATVLAQQLLDGATNETCIAVVSAPSALIQLKNLLVCGCSSALRFFSICFARMMNL